MAGRRSRIDWHKQVIAHEKSGLSVAEYCRKQGFSSWSFYINRKKIRSSGNSVIAKSNNDSSLFFHTGIFNQSQVTVRFPDSTILEIASFSSPDQFSNLITSLKQNCYGDTTGC